MQLAPYITLVALLWGWTAYRIFKPYKKEPIRNKWDYLERAGLDLGYLLGSVTCAVMIWPGAQEWLAKLL